MPKTTKIEPVTGGWIKRSAKTGRVLAVGSAKGVSKPATATKQVVGDVSERRSEALKRLVNR